MAVVLFPEVETLFASVWDRCSSDISRNSEIYAFVVQFWSRKPTVTGGNVAPPDSDFRFYESFIGWTVLHIQIYCCTYFTALFLVSNCIYIFLPMTWLLFHPQSLRTAQAFSELIVAPLPHSPVVEVTVLFPAAYGGILS